MTNVVLLRNPRALLVPDVFGLIKRAVKSVELAADGIEGAAQELFDYCTNEDLFMFLGFEDGHAHALLMGYFPASSLFPYPMVSLIYNEGSKKLLRMLVADYGTLMEQRGFSRTWAMNGSGRSDAAWIRSLLGDTFTGKKIASMMQLTLK